MNQRGAFRSPSLSRGSKKSGNVWCQVRMRRAKRYTRVCVRPENPQMRRRVVPKEASGHLRSDVGIAGGFSNEMRCAFSELSDHADITQIPARLRHYICVQKIIDCILNREYVLPTENLNFASRKFGADATRLHRYAKHCGQEREGRSCISILRVLRNEADALKSHDLYSGKQKHIFWPKESIQRVKNIMMLFPVKKACFMGFSSIVLLLFV